MMYKVNLVLVSTAKNNYFSLCTNYKKLFSVKMPLYELIK